MSLSSLMLPTMMDTSSNDLIKDFFIPALSLSSRYDRGVGFFSSGWLRLSAAGMVEFAANGGRARWVTSPILDESDWEAMQAGNAARTDSILHKALSRNITNIEEALDKDTLSALAWMVADEIITFKLALPHNKLERGNFHDKFGIFTDTEGSRVSFIGSYNDSVQGTRNYESIKIFCSWNPALVSFVEDDVLRFERLWENRDQNVRVFELPEAAREQILSLRTRERPYSKLTSNNPTISGVPDKRGLWTHQSKAIEAFLEQERGILEMATGTGKTRTALEICKELVEGDRIETIIIAADGNDLLDQWHKQLLQLRNNIGKTFIVHREYANHHDREKFLLNQRNKIFLSSRQKLHLALNRIKPSEAKKTLLIHDEVHKLGSPGNRESLEGLSDKITFRLGLSATPEREYDQEGNVFIENHVGKVLIRFELADAIRQGILAPFNYYPIEYYPNEDDAERIQRVRKKAAAREAEGHPMSEEEIWIDIARVHKTSKAKLPLFDDFIKNHQDLLKRCIVFVETKEYGDEVLDIIHKYRYDFHTYYADEDSATLLRFAKGDIECLLTCHRLSEGIDIKSIETVVLFSSARARLETIQRMGRCLRINPDHPEKCANIVDFIRLSDGGKHNPDIERREWLTQLSELQYEEDG